MPIYFKSTPLQRTTDAGATSTIEDDDCTRRPLQVTLTMKIRAFTFIIHTETTSNIIRPSKRRTLGHPRLKLATKRPQQSMYTGASLVKVHLEVAIVGHSNKRYWNQKERKMRDKQNSHPRLSHTARTRDPYGKWPGYLLQHDPRSALLLNSTIQGGFFFKHSGRPSRQSKHFKTANTNRRAEEKGKSPMPVTNVATLRYPDEKGPKPTGVSNN
ncbi:hypothetical protein CRG98_012403 [Punica granatum]|uniref:Uncharacterized protein n=1 Tax=Punica granatum TaxID=22663 RepID=A0A2I0KHB9_PUNGR|nr:hypothetical protein CRG98_012403 [Punica granatum]